MKTVLQKIVESTELLARFINTLSLLEYIGARKIIKSQPQESLNEEILAHMYEEVRHAQVLKRAALKLAPELCATYAKTALLKGDAACRYIQTVDHAAQEAFAERDPWRSYLYTTFLVEERANSLYPMIDEVLSAAGKNPLFRGILEEEQRHLAEISAWLKEIPEGEAKILQLRTIEVTAFEQWSDALCHAIM